MGSHTRQDVLTPDVCTPDGVGRRNVIVNLHLFKTGGTTLKDTLTRNYGRNHLDLVRDGYWGSADLTGELDRHVDAVALTRHMIALGGIQDTDRYRFFPVFFLREPVAWLVSVYHFQRYKPMTGRKMKIYDACTIIARTSRDITEFARVFAREERNIMNEYIRGVIMTRADGTTMGIDEFMSGIGRYHVGITDRYDESCVVLEEGLRRHFPGIDLSYGARRNRTPTSEYAAIKSKLEDLRIGDNRRLVDALADMNGDATELYRRVGEELDARISGTKDFDAKLEKFRDRCRIALAVERP